MTSRRRAAVTITVLIAGITIHGAAVRTASLGAPTPPSAHPTVLAAGPSGAGGGANALRELQLLAEADTTAATATAGATAPVALGSDPILTVDADPAATAYIRFRYAGTAAAISAAVLRVHVADDASAPSPGSVSGGAAFGVSDDTWDEQRMTRANRPRLDAHRNDLVGPVMTRQWVEFDVTAAVRTSGAVISLAISSTNPDGVRYDSRENIAYAPTLTLSLGWSPRAAADAVVVAAVGDIACPPGEFRTDTACHERSVSDAIVHDPEVQAFLPLGDLQYPAGSLGDFQNGYDLTFGRLNQIAHPAVGNHEYGQPGASGYFAYFGARAGDPKTGYYSFDLGPAWHVVVLNSNCTVVSCAVGSAQEQFLRADLAATAAPCTVLTWHHPRFSSGIVHGDNPEMAALWQAAVDAHVDLVLSGHDHDYERFAPQGNDRAALATAPRQFVVGTGGRDVRGFRTPSANSEERVSEFGYLWLALEANSYEWKFRTESGDVRDSGRTTCHT